MNIKLSVVIITFNEERNIERCLLSVKDIADEIVVVDSFSKDKTKEICLKHQVKFVEHKFDGHIEQKNWAITQAQYPHILSLDADEALDDKLIKNILAIKQNWQYDGYEMNRLTNYCGTWIKHCGWYPDTKLRIVKKSEARWGGVNPHDALVVKGEVSHLKGDLLHYSYNSISSHVLQTNKFSTIEARSLFDNGKRVGIVKLVTRPIYQFFKDYFLKRGFLDGRYGFVICSLNSLYVLLKYAKMIDLQKSKSL